MSIYLMFSQHFGRHLPSSYYEKQKKSKNTDKQNIKIYSKSSWFSSIFLYDIDQYLFFSFLFTNLCAQIVCFVIIIVSHNRYLRKFYWWTAYTDYVRTIHLINKKYTVKGQT